MAGIACLIENSIANSEITHICKALRSWNWRVKSKLLTIFLAYFNEGCPKLPLPAPIHDAENVPDDLLLPGKQPEGFSRPFALGVFQVLNEFYRAVCFRFVIMAGGKHEPRRSIAFQLGNAFRSRFFHHFPLNSSSISSSAAPLPSPAIILLLDAGVRPNCVPRLFMIFK